MNNEHGLIKMAQQRGDAFYAKMMFNDFRKQHSTKHL